MLFLLSPAKSLDFEPVSKDVPHTQPRFLAQAEPLIKILRQQSPAQIAELMSLSDKLAVLNVTRYADWSPEHTAPEAKQAILAFNGDVYEGLDAPSLNKKQLAYVQDHVRVLSGLYGVLRPLDLMRPYRLEMGTKLANPAGKDLYAWWRERNTACVLDDLKAAGQPLVNTASDEYFKSVDRKALEKAGVTIIDTVFEDWKDGKFKIISFYAKRARGLFVRAAAEGGWKTAEDLQKFDAEGYEYTPAASTEQKRVFRRRQA
ncbi:MAG: peroxide stress protein YaaA [Fluviibacter sp.]|jgi:cytoplasmic iron level regulating protein YaaA (DUF328/UPF0246 family)